LPALQDAKAEQDCFWKGFMKNRAKIIAFYLPQYHPIPENDEWWGKGFTEWTNAAKAKPMFKGHYQPHIPADLGFYDLRLPEARIAQAEMAREYGVDAFCYYHYWFAGKRLLERPLNEMVQSKQPDFPFCICWANQTWTGIWHGNPGRILVEQTYPGENDHRLHFQTLLPSFIDPRYVTVDGKPVFLIVSPNDMPDSQRVTDFWRQMALKAGLKGLYIIGVTTESDWRPQDYGFDASTLVRFPKPRWISRRRPMEWLIDKFQKKTGKPAVYLYEEVLSELSPLKITHSSTYPCIMPNWDNTPRSGERGFVLHDSKPELFRVILKSAIKIANEMPDNQKIIFIKSWNEWAEGNYLEPDLKFGRAYLEVIKKEVLE
jgi:hypothetical protein